MISNTQPPSWQSLPASFAHAMPILHELPAPQTLLRLLDQWQNNQLDDTNTTQQRLYQQLLDWETQRHQMSMQLPENSQQWENFRRMLLSLLSSPWVLLTALAVHLAQLRQFKQHTTTEQQQLSLLSQSIYAPLANRLGLSKWKWEIEDIAFRLAHPQEYTHIAKALASKRVERESFIEHMRMELQAHFAQEQLTVNVSGRPKHIFSIYKKMQQKSLTFDQLYDLHALRVLTQSIEDCYRVLGILHQHYVPLLKEFDDYIARPKANGYQSIHTVIMGYNGWPVEVQIRTEQMHQLAEEGVAAHWRYKEGKAQDDQLNQLVQQLRHSLSHELDAQSLEAWEKELMGKHIFVLTPKGDVLRLVQGATALDFAYSVHTELGHSCRGALVNGVIKPLDEPLNSGDRVEILSQKQGKPNLNWLSGHFLASNRARNKVKAYFNKLAADEHLLAGKAQLDRLRARFRLDNNIIPFLIQRFNFVQNEKTLMMAIGQGRISSEQLSKAIQHYLHPSISPPSNQATTQAAEQHIDSRIFIPGVGAVRAHLAQCCQPKPPEPIIGLLTRQHGLRIHRQNCRDLLALPAQSHERLLHVRWGGFEEAETTLCLDILAIERDNLLVDLVNCLTKASVRISHFQATPGQHPNSLHIHLMLAMAADQDWLALMDKLDELPNIISVTYCLDEHSA